MKRYGCIVEAIDEGQSAMLQILKRAGAALGDAIDDVIGIVNPHTVILGGYLGALSPLPAGLDQGAHRPSGDDSRVCRHQDRRCGTGCAAGGCVAQSWRLATPASTTRCTLTRPV